MTSLLINSARGLRVTSKRSMTTAAPSSPPPNTHYKITLRRSAISLGAAKQGTLVSMGIHRRHQTVYQKHSPEAAGKILAVKELLEVENVPECMVQTVQQQNKSRKAVRGYSVVANKRKSVF